MIDGSNVREFVVVAKGKKIGAKHEGKIRQKERKGLTIQHVADVMEMRWENDNEKDEMSRE